MTLFKGALLCCFMSALGACTGNVKPVARPATPTAESVRTLLSVMHFDEAVIPFVQTAEASARAAMARVAEKQAMNTEQRRLFDEMEERMVGVLEHEFGWDRLGPIMISTIQAAYSQQDVDALVSIFESPAGQEVAAQFPLISKELSPGIVRKIDGNPSEKQPVEEALVREFVPHISPSARDAFAAFGRTAVGQDIVSRTPAWHTRYEEQVALLKADGMERIRSLREDYKERIRAASAAK